MIREGNKRIKKLKGRKRGEMLKRKKQGVRMVKGTNKTLGYEETH